MNNLSMHIEVRLCDVPLSPSLFDYDSHRSRRIAARKMQNGCFVFVDPNDKEKPTTLLSANSAALGLAPTKGSLLCYVKKTNNRYSLMPGDWPDSFLSLRGSRMGQLLHVGDQIRLGKKTFRVTRLKCGLKDTKTDSRSELAIATQSIGGVCRICLSDEAPLIRACDCRGSCGAVHVDCLRTWLTSRVVCNRGGMNWVLFDKLQCQLCKRKLPKTIVVEGVQEQLVHLPREQPELMELECVEERAVVVIPFRLHERVWVGRGPSNQLHIQDTTVSRSHAWFDLREDGIYVGDLDSKFGTLISFSNPQPFSHTLSLQCGRMLFTFTPQ